MKLPLFALLSASLMASSSFAQGVQPPQFIAPDTGAIVQKGPIDLSSDLSAMSDKSGGKGFNSIKIPGVGEFGKDGAKNDVPGEPTVSQLQENLFNSEPSIDETTSAANDVLKSLMHDPKKLMALALYALENQKSPESGMQDAISRYFLIRLADQNKAVWLGDTSNAKTAYAFVDWSSEFAATFVKSVEDFSEKSGVKTILIPSWVNIEQRDAALAVSSITQNGSFVDFYNEITKLPNKYSGNPLDYASVDLPSAALDMNTVDPIEAAHLMLAALQAPQPMILMSEGIVFSGNISDSNEMVAFFNKNQPSPKVQKGPSVGHRMPLP